MPLEDILIGGIERLGASFHTLIDNILPSGTAADLRNDPLFTLLGPVRHYLGGFLARNLVDFLYHHLSGEKEKHSSILKHPAALFAYSILPDIDHYIGLAHRGVSHSLGFAAVVGAITYAAALLTKNEKKLLYFLLPFGIVAAHIGVDLFIEGGNPVKALWPISDKSFQLFSDVNMVGYTFIVAAGAYAWRYRESKK